MPIPEEMRENFKYGRVVRVRPCNKPFVTFADEGHVLSGVEITVSNQEFCRPTEENTVFLGMAELLKLLEALEGELAVCKKQYDWTCDWT